MTCKCHLCGREDVQFGGIITLDIPDKNGEILEPIRSVFCADCGVSLGNKIKEIEDDYKYWRMNNDS